MYHLYHTQAFVLRSTDTGEANKYYSLFTREFGLIRASAQSVRAAHSKLRPGLIDYAHTNISLVRGKNTWRLTSAVSIGNVYQELSGSKEVSRMFARSFALLSRLLQGEEKNAELFDHVLSAYHFARHGSYNSMFVSNFEYVLVLRILHSLGYVGSAPEIVGFINSLYWSDEVLQRMDHVKVSALQEINKSLKASQL
jgi:recombinational DNA repair protein (RecF pathway)